MPTTDNGITPETITDRPQQNAAEKLRKTVYIGFAGIVAVTLMVAGLYVGGRVFAAQRRMPAAPAPVAKTVVAPRPVASATAPAAVVPAPVAAAPVPAVAVPAPSKKPLAAPVWNLVNPEPGELYLQVAALGRKATDEFLPTLESRGLHPVVAPGPDPTVYRVLIGPFPDRETLKRQEQALDADGLQHLVRSY